MESVQFREDNLLEVWNFIRQCPSFSQDRSHLRLHSGTLVLETSGGDVTLQRGWWIVHTSDGFHACHPSVYAALTGTTEPQFSPTIPDDGIDDTGFDDPIADDLNEESLVPAEIPPDPQPQKGKKKRA